MQDEDWADIAKSYKEKGFLFEVSVATFGKYKMFAPREACSERMFGEILRNPEHTLHHLLPPINQAKSRLRTRAHDRAMPLIKGHALSLSKKSFINRMLMLNSY